MMRRVSYFILALLLILVVLVLGLQVGSFDTGIATVFNALDRKSVV